MLHLASGGADDGDKIFIASPQGVSGRFWAVLYWLYWLITIRKADEKSVYAGFSIFISRKIIDSVKQGRDMALTGNAPVVVSATTNILQTHAANLSLADNGT